MSSPESIAPPLADRISAAMLAAALDGRRSTIFRPIAADVKMPAAVRMEILRTCGVKIQQAPHPLAIEFAALDGQGIPAVLLYW
jgi:hypothetical protein